MMLLGRGGYLITCSCSRFMEIENFEKMLRESAQEAGVTLKQVSLSLIHICGMRKAFTLTGM